MVIRSIDKKDLPMMAKLVKDESIKTMEDICYEHSKICLSDDGEILCFIVLREHSLMDFFNGVIPKDENLNDDAEEGEEWWVKEDIESYVGKHYEIVAAYLKDIHYSGDYSNLLYAIEFEGWKPQIGILWSVKDLPVSNNFYHFNNTVWLDMPMMD